MKTTTWKIIIILGVAWLWFGSMLLWSAAQWAVVLAGLCAGFVTGWYVCTWFWMWFLLSKKMDAQLDKVFEAGRKMGNTEAMLRIDIESYMPKPPRSL